MTKVLVVDADAVSRFTLEHVLTTAGFDVVGCDRVDGVDGALRILSLALFDLVVCDHGPAGRTGLDLVAEAAGCPTPFLLLMDHDAEHRPADIGELPVVTPVLKPVDATELLAVAGRLTVGADRADRAML